MHKIKIFKNIESEIPLLEEEINEWLAESGAKVVQMTGNIAPQTPSNTGMGGSSFSSSDVLVLIVYED
tara:strand:- start:370 stop:573 length:204 start_codon:yes stop_codon:yes gene_type:complete